MITINGQQYNEPLGKGLPYYRIDKENGLAAILPYGATKYIELKEHVLALATFYSRAIAQTPIVINSSTHNRLELSTTITGGRRIPFPTYIKEGLNGPGYMYDHINNDETDDTDTNLRPVNATQNSYNKKLAKNNTSGFKGVAANKSGNWGAGISYNYNYYCGGTFKTKIAAALSYNELAKKYHGEYASLNPVTMDMLYEVYRDPATRMFLIKDLAKLDERYGTDWSRVLAA